MNKKKTLLQIEKDIPLPPRMVAHKELADSIGIGESILFPEYNQAQGFRLVLAKLGKRGTLKREGYGARIWRIK